MCSTFQASTKTAGTAANIINKLDILGSIKTRNSHFIHAQFVGNTRLVRLRIMPWLWTRGLNFRIPGDGPCFIFDRAVGSLGCWPACVDINENEETRILDYNDFQRLLFGYNSAIMALKCQTIIISCFCSERESSEKGKSGTYFQYLAGPTEVK